MSAPRPSTIDKKAAILAHATELFAARGFDRVSLKDIAAAADVLPGSLYYFHPRKGDLYSAVVNAAFDYFLHRLVPEIEVEAEPGEKLRRFFRTLVTLFAGDAPQSRIIERELFEARDRPMPLLGHAIFARLHEAMNPVIRALAPEPADEARIDQVTSHLFSLAYGTVRLLPIHARLADGRVPDRPEPIAEDLCRIVTSMLRGGYADAGQSQ